MPKASSSPVQDLTTSVVGRLRHPWLFVLLGVLLAVDLVIPDPVPFVDEIILAVLTLLVGTWRTRKKNPPQAVVDVRPSPPGEPPPDRRP